MVGLGHCQLRFHLMVGPGYCQLSFHLVVGPGYSQLRFHLVVGPGLSAEVPLANWSWALSTECYKKIVCYCYSFQNFLKRPLEPSRTV